MSVLKIKITEDHINVARKVNLPWFFETYRQIEEGEFTQKEIEGEIYDELGLILFGKPEGEFDPTSSESIDWSSEQKSKMFVIFGELIHTINIMLSLGTIELGEYKTKYHDINWKKVG